jgi:hypothetical protein
MSYTFQLSAESPVLWWPSNREGRLYVGIAKVVAAEPDIPDLDTWLTEWTPDDHFVDPAGLKVFLEAALAKIAHKYAARPELIWAFLAQSVALLIAAGGSIEATTEDHAELIAAAQERARVMVR